MGDYASSRQSGYLFDIYSDFLRKPESGAGIGERRLVPYRDRHSRSPARAVNSLQARRRSSLLPSHASNRPIRPSVRKLVC